MKISGKSIRSLKKLNALVGNAKSIRLVYDFSGVDTNSLAKIGFNKTINIGDYLLPQAIGKISSFNANGKEVIRKDLPKEPKARSFYTTWEDWHGNRHSGLQTRLIDMYPRDYVPAPTEYLYAIETEISKYISSDEIILGDRDEDEILHLANLMLECFGEFEILDTTSGAIIGQKLRNLNWDILPPGKYPWSISKPIIERATEGFDKSDKEVIRSRMKTLSVYNPDFLATGKAGFNGYIIYGFESRSIYILESIFLDNATYIFTDDWERLSQLTKNEIINGDVSHTRVIHDKAWKYKIGRILC